MSRRELSQKEADHLIELEKEPVDGRNWQFPVHGEQASLDLKSLDGREEFLLDVNRRSISLKKKTFQNRYHSTVILVRLDLGGSPHRNPDGQELPCPHIHIYRERYGDKWAFPIDPDSFPDVEDVNTVFSSFLDYCNVINFPTINMVLY